MLVEADDVTGPEILAWMAQGEDHARTQQVVGVGTITSIAGLVLQANGGEMPQTSEQVRQCLQGVAVPLKRNLVKMTLLEEAKTHRQIKFANNSYAHLLSCSLLKDNFASTISLYISAADTPTSSAS